MPMPEPVINNANRIHLVERQERFERIEGDVWESSFWALRPDKAERLIGGKIYFHKKQKEPSFFGGRIIGFRQQPDGEFAGRLVFRFEYRKDCRSVSAGPEPWTSFEMKVVIVD